MSRSVALFAAGLAAAGALAASAGVARDRAAAAPVRVDHHLHVHSPAILAYLPAYCASPGRIGACPAAFTKPLTPTDLLAEMDRAGIRRGAIMSTAYLAESPMMVPPRADAVRIVSAANDWTVALARRYPTRLAAFIGIDPITPTALPEIARWRGDRAVTGIKLHLTNSGVDLRNPDHRRALAAVFRAAADAKLAIMIHMRTRATDYGSADVRLFIRDVLPAARGTTVQIAHAAGWGGTDPATLSALGAFADAIQARPRSFRHVYFDLAAVWKDDTGDAERQAMAQLIRRIGPAHFLPASDWPFSADLVDYYGRVYPELPLTEQEWTVIRTNVAPYWR